MKPSGVRRETQILGLILLVGAGLRLYGLCWDDGQWLHPDERQIYFITTGLGWPSSLREALSPESPLNPGFFAYGSFPFYLLKAITALLAPMWPALRDPDNLHLIGRPLAALFDLGTVFITYCLARSLLAGPARPRAARDGALVAAALVSLAVLHVQLAHFYTTDPLLTFFVMLTLTLASQVARGGGRRWQIVLGIAFGLAMANKISAAVLVVAILAACWARTTGQGTLETRCPSRQTLATFPFAAPVRCMLPTIAVAAVVFALIQPYAWIDWQTFLSDTIRESQIAWGLLDAPYTRQYAGTLPYVYSAWQTARWGLVLPLGIVAWGALGAATFRSLRREPRKNLLLLAWAGPYLAITGLLYARYLRYMLPLVPILCLLAAQFLFTPRIRDDAADEPSPLVRRRAYLVVAIAVLVLFSLGYVLAFASIYAEPHSWVTASEWIYMHVPQGSTLAIEEWDTALPLPLDIGSESRRIEEYRAHTLPLYAEPDDTGKWEMLAGTLAKSDYLIIASRRLYGSISRLPERYPLTARYYELLFDGQLGYELVEEFTRGPAWLNPRLPPLPDAARPVAQPDESFVVYDHPRVLVFRNADRLQPDELVRRLQ
jgi:hypothetical protein